MFGTMHRRLRALTIGASLLALCACGASLTMGSTAHADGDLRLDARQPMAPHAIARFNEAHSAALLTQAPTSVRGRCVTTIYVPGQGPSCRFGDTNLWGVRLRDGTTAVTHGADILPSTAPVIDPETALGLQDAGDLTTYPADSGFVTCATDARTPHYTAIYARRSGSTAIEADVKKSIRAALRQASEFTRAQSIAQGSAVSAGVTMRFACAADQIDVRTANVGTTGPIGFVQLIDAVEATGVNASNTSTSRMVIFSDQPNSSNAAGQGYVYPDDRATTGNFNNDADLVAAHYLVSDPSTPTAYWDIFIHEMFHNFGATQDAAPDANGEGHCDTDKDVMCYQEQATTQNGRGVTAGTALPTYSVAACGTTKLDCGGNTYFNAGPAPTGWIATHWNAGHPRNRWLDFGTRNIDTIAPATPGGVRATAVTPTSATIAWDAVNDDTAGAVSYRVYVRPSGGSTSLVEAGTGLTTTLSNLAPGSTINARIDARDAAGNLSLRGPETSIALPGDGTAVTGGGVVDAQPKAGAAPGRPSFPVISSLTARTARITWKRAERGGAVVSWRVRTQPAGGRPSSVYVPATDLSATVAVVPGVPTTVFVDAVNDAGTTTSLATRVVGRTAGSTCTWSERDTTAPRKPSGLRVSSRGRTKVVLRFRPATDRSICAYQTVRLVRGTWRAVGAPLAFAARVAAFTGLTRNAAQQLGIRSIDASGNVSATVKVIARTTR
ncbi:MAG: endoglucanase [Thermoleophilia bacterium]|nr:endoglucanase [Thermoleophilia bacterium]